MGTTNEEQIPVSEGDDLHKKSLKGSEFWSGMRHRYLMKVLGDENPEKWAALFEELSRKDPDVAKKIGDRLQRFDQKRWPYDEVMEDFENEAAMREDEKNRHERRINNAVTSYMSLTGQELADFFRRVRSLLPRRPL